MKASALRVLSSALGLPCWRVRWDSQVGLDMNFGPPRMETREPRRITGGSPRVRAQFARRAIYLRGSHWLVVSPGTWRLVLADGLSVRDTSSAKRLDMAVARLNGEMLDGVSVDGHTGASVFHFDLGAQIFVRGRLGRSDDTELWSLSSRARVVEIHAGGRYRSGSVKRPMEHEVAIGSQVVVARNARARDAMLGKPQG